jgi:hypothetical protein
LQTKSINIVVSAKEAALLLFTTIFPAMLAPLLTLVTLFASPVVVRASPCVAFDINWNLLAFGLDGKDWNAGTQDTWASGTYLRSLLIHYLNSLSIFRKVPPRTSLPLGVRELL